MTKLNFKLISIKGRINMFEKKSSTTDQTNTTEDSFNVLRPKKGSAKVVIGNGVKIKGEITDADEVQIDGSADVTMNTDNLMIGGTGDLKGTITSHNADVWGKLDGEVKVRWYIDNTRTRIGIWQYRI